MTGVSAQRELIDGGRPRARSGARAPRALLDFHRTGLSPVLAERLRPLFKHDVALAGYHLPLTRTRRWGTTRSWPSGWAASATSLRPLPRHADRPGRDVPRQRRCRPLELFARVRKVTRPVSRPCSTAGRSASGGSASSRARRPTRWSEATELGSRRIPDRRAARARDGRRARSGVRFVAAGHYATETFGVRALGDWLADRFGSSTWGSTSPIRSENTNVSALLDSLSAPIPFPRYRAFQLGDLAGGIGLIAIHLRRHGARAGGGRGTARGRGRSMEISMPIFQAGSNKTLFIAERRRARRGSTTAEVRSLRPDPRRLPFRRPR